MLKQLMASQPDVNSAAETLARRQSELERAQSKLDDTKRDLHTALSKPLDGATRNKLESAVTKAETAVRRKQDAVDAAQEQLREAQNAERERESLNRKQRLTDTLNARTTLAAKLHRNAKERADMIHDWIEADETLAELQSAGVVSQNAVQNITYGIGRLLTLLGFEDRRATVDLEGQHRAFPYTGQAVVDRTKIPDLRETIAADNRTIKGD